MCINWGDARCGKKGWGVASKAHQIAYLQIEKLWQRTRGAGVRVAVLDSGVQTSAALPAKRVERLRADGQAPSPTADPHGTFCASLIASEKADTEGIAPEAKILSIQVSTASTNIAAANVASALALALARGCDVISCSFTLNKWGGKQQQILDLVRQAHLAGIPVLGAHGNTPGQVALFPETVPHAITVSANNDAGRPLAVNHNAWTDIFALGDRLHVVDTAGLRVAWPGQTSGATAIVSGVVALCLSAVSKSKRARVGMAIEGLLKTTGTTMASSTQRRINAQKLMDAVIAL